MPFGIASAPSIFQRVMDDMFRDLPWVKCYLDDILITGRNAEEHWQEALEVLSGLQRAGVRLQREKCLFAVPELPYLGFVVSSEGLKTSPSKVKAILDTSTPSRFDFITSLLGVGELLWEIHSKAVCFGGTFEKTTKEKKRWNWMPEQEESWLNFKTLLVSAQVLCAYNTRLPPMLACEASPFGVAAVLSHQFPDGSERPIAYANEEPFCSRKELFSVG